MCFIGELILEGCWGDSRTTRMRALRLTSSQDGVKVGEKQASREKGLPAVRTNFPQTPSRMEPRLLYQFIRDFPKAGNWEYPHPRAAPYDWLEPKEALQ